MVRPARVLTVLSLTAVALPLLTNWLSEAAPHWLTLPAVVIPLTVLAFVAVAVDTVRSLRPQAETVTGPDALYEERLLAATRRTLDAMDRTSLDAEAGVQLGALARVPLSLRATGPEIGAHSAITRADDLIAAVVELRGALSLALVGEPGSGRTTFLRDIAWALTEDTPARRRRGEAPALPVLVDAAAWRGGSGLEEHLRATLGRSSAVPPGVVDRWLTTGIVYLLIDNLSRLPAPVRRKVIGELNAFQERHRSVGLLVTADEDGTRAQGAELGLPALLIERATEEQVLMHLARVRGTHGELYRVARSSREVVEVMRTRMLLTAALLAFPDTEGTELRLSAGNPREVILRAYTDSMLAHVEGRTAILTHLSWIAAQLQRMDAFSFRDYLTVSWIRERSRRRTISPLTGDLLGLVAATRFGGHPGAAAPDSRDLRGAGSAGAVHRGAGAGLGGDPRRAGADGPPPRLVVGPRIPARLPAADRAGDDRQSGLRPAPAQPARTGLELLRRGATPVGAGVRADLGAGGDLPRARPGLAAGRGGHHELGGRAGAAARTGTCREAFRPALADGLSAAAVVFVAVLVGLLGLRFEVTIVEASLRDDGVIPADLPAFLESATRLALLQRTGGNEYMFSHQILRDHFAAGAVSPDRRRTPRPSGPAR